MPDNRGIRIPETEPNLDQYMGTGHKKRSFRRSQLTVQKMKRETRDLLFRQIKPSKCPDGKLKRYRKQAKLMTEIYYQKEFGMPLTRIAKDQKISYEKARYLYNKALRNI